MRKYGVVLAMCAMAVATGSAQTLQGSRIISPTGALTLLGLSGQAEDLIWDLGGTANTAVITSSTGVTQIDWTGMAARSIRAGIGTTSTDGLILANTTAAAAGAQQYSPRLRYRGAGWKTDATAASQVVDFVTELVPVQGAAAPTGNLNWASSIGGAGYSTRMTLTSAGSLGIGTTDPLTRLHIVGGNILLDNDASVQFKDAGGVRRIVFAFNTDDDFRIGDNGGGTDSILFSVEGKADAMVVKETTGHVGIGTTVPDGLFSLGGANGQQAWMQQATTTVTCDGGGATCTATSLIPAGSIVYGVATRVTTTLSGAGLTTWKLGDGTTTDAFAATQALTAGTTSGLAQHISTWTPKVYTAATNVVMTANAGQFDAGVVRITVWYLGMTAPTS